MVGELLDMKRCKCNDLKTLPTVTHNAGTRED